MSTTGSICIDSRPPGAAIQFDGEDTGKKTPCRLDSKDVGCHTLMVSLPAPSETPPVSTNVNVTAGGAACVTLTLMTPENKSKAKLIAYYTFFFMVILVGIALVNRAGRLPIPDSLTQNILYFALAGGLGSLVFNMYEYFYHVSVGDFNIDFFAWYMFRPFVGILYGTFIFFLVAGGLMTLSGVNAPSFADLLTQKTVMFYLALSFLAGYAEEPVSLQLKALAEAIFKKPGQEGQGDKV